MWGLRDRFEPAIAEAVRAKRVTDTVSGLGVTLSSKASNEYCEQFEPLMRSMEPSIALIRAAKCERESQ